MKLRTGDGEHDCPMPYSLYVGYNSTWNSGTLYPIENEQDSQGQQEGAFVGECFNAPEYLQVRREGFSNVLGDQDIFFDQAQAYYIGLQVKLASLPINAQSTVAFGNVLSITCNKSDDLLYHLSIDEATLSQIDLYILNNCNFFAIWIIDVTGEGQVHITGAPFPGIVERVIYNILGCNRLITICTGVAANILSPNNDLSIPSGVTRGIIIVGNLLSLIQANKPDCTTCQVQITTRTAEVSCIGWKKIYVISLNNIQPGDTICIDGGCQKITDIEDGEGKHVIVLTNPLDYSIPKDCQITVNAQCSGLRDAQAQEWIEYETISSSASVTFSLLLFVLIAQFL